MAESSAEGAIWWAEIPCEDRRHSRRIVLEDATAPRAQHQRIALAVGGKGENLARALR